MYMMARVQQDTDCNYLPMAVAFELSVPFLLPSQVRMTR